MLRWILVGVLTLGIAGVGFWGYQEHQEKNAVLIQAENNYQRAFHELSYHMDLMHDKIGTALAMNSRESLSPQMVEIWRLTSEAVSDVGQLPLTLMPFNKTEEFLSNIGDFTYKTAVRDLQNEPLNDQEIKTLKNLYEQSGELKDELRQVQHTVLDENLRWMDVQLALAQQDEQSDNTIVDGFKTVEKKVEGYAESNADSALTGTSSEEHEYQNLPGQKISQEEAAEKGRQLLSMDNKGDLNVTETGDGADVPIYSISYQNDNKNGYLDITKQGGHPLTLLVNRDVQKQNISLNKGLEKAKDYLKQFNFEDMEVLTSNQYDNVGVYSFLYNQDGVRIYSDAIEMKVALDNSELLGLTARNYFMNHKEREIPEPELSIEEAKEKVNPDVEINEDYMAVIDNDVGEEVLVYEFLGVLDNETYRIFINAMDGTEEKVEKLGGTEINYASNS
ncbi:germination protein YpeB [Lentibacillus amyloliquefaciens]|uniref:Germination protein YpeB n=1 Tax=Lentibacillus amyloliquefaciens TaxID=1472767 RepID=A0A0U4F328_9BACI|nr:germination protein YpeB [Lentibacillus amyloliquefaciens]ALX47974.1 germination protein YpeB [Lentibacillus amyloliquefaciens]